MEVLIISQSQVQKLLPMKECINVMEEALKALARDNAHMPMRSAMWLPDKAGLLGMMPAFIGGSKVMGIKIVSVFPGNHGTEYDSHQGAVMLFETKHGKPLAIVDASSITAIRTAATSAVATDLLARKDAGDLAVLGSGIQARGHLEAIMLVRRIRRVRVWSLPLDDARQFAGHMSKRHGITVEPVETARAAVQGADIICTTTPASEPILFGDWIMDGAHINAVGSCAPQTRELDTDAVAKSRLFVDRREAALNEAGDFLIPKKEGAIGDDHILGEIGDILVGDLDGRKSESEITLFKSLGLAVEDLASAQYVYRRALERHIGTSVEL